MPVDFANHDNRVTGFGLALIAWVSLACSVEALNPGQGQCQDGDAELRACETAGQQTRSCSDGQWGAWSACDTSSVCNEGDDQTGVCGPNERGSQSRRCEAGQWSPWSPCVDDDVCRDNDTEQEECVPPGSGTRARTCVDGDWGEWSTCGSNPVLAELLSLLESSSATDLFNGYVLISMRSSETDLVQSTEYRWPDFVAGFRTMATTGIGGEVFYVGASVEVAMVNIAAFLAQSMQETIQYNACDENNWSVSLGVPDYPVAAACGQWGQDYQEYRCTAAQAHMQCPVDPQMMVMARTQAAWYGAPPPLFCAPKSVTGDQTPRWNASAGWCDPGDPQTIPEFLAGPLASPWIESNVLGVDAASCMAYEGQKAGLFTFAGCPADGCWNSAQMDTAGGQLRNNVEGCCWWGRGVIQTTGVCNFGKLNYYLAGREYLLDGADVRVKHQHDTAAPYADLDFCENPELVCTGPGELKWIAGMLYWLNSVQGYPTDDAYDWNFKEILDTDALAIFAAPDGPEARAFLDATSGVVNRGCPALTCPGAGAVHHADKRLENFKTVMEIMRHVFAPLTYPAPAGLPAPLASGS